MPCRGKPWQFGDARDPLWDVGLHVTQIICSGAATDYSVDKAGGLAPGGSSPDFRTRGIDRQRWLSAECLQPDSPSFGPWSGPRRPRRPPSWLEWLRTPDTRGRVYPLTDEDNSGFCRSTARIQDSGRERPESARGHALYSELVRLGPAKQFSSERKSCNWARSVSSHGKQTTPSRFRRASAEAIGRPGVSLRCSVCTQQSHCLEYEAPGESGSYRPDVQRQRGLFPRAASSSSNCSQMPPLHRRHMWHPLR